MRLMSILKGVEVGWIQRQQVGGWGIMPVACSFPFLGVKVLNI